MQLVHLQVYITMSNIAVFQAYGVDGLEVRLGDIVPSSQCVVRITSF